MSRRGRKKTPLEAKSYSLLKYLKPDTHSEAQRCVKEILDSLVEKATTPFVEEIIDEMIDKAMTLVTQPPSDSNEKAKKKHETVADKTFIAWEQKYPWLGKTEKNGVISMYCAECKHAACTDKKITSVWGHEATQNIQLSAVTRHNDSTEHADVIRKKVCVVQVEVESDESDDEDEMPSISLINDDKILFNTIYHAAKCEMSTTNINGLIELQKKNGLDCKYSNLSWDTVTEIQSCIAKTLTDNIVHDIKGSIVYAIMLDESTDIGVDKRLSICVRYVKNGEPCSTFLCSLHLDDGCAISIVNCVVRELTKLGIPLENCVSLATDGAAVMMGHKTGVGVQIKSKYAPFCLQTHCVAHRLNLACVDSIKEHEFLVKFRDKFKQLFNFITASANRVLALKNIQNLLNEPELSVKDPHTVRWLGLKNAVEAVFESYSSILATLSKFAAEKSPVAKGLLKYFSSYKVALVTAFMLDVHTELSVLSCSLQKQNLSFSEICPMMEGTIAKIDTMKQSDGQALQEMNSTMIETSEGEKKLKGEKLSYKSTMDKEFQTIRECYTKCLSKNIKKRLHKKDGELLSDFSFVLEPLNVISAEVTDIDNSLERLSVFFGSEKKTKIVEGNLLEGTVVNEKKIKPLIDGVKLKEEWIRLRGMITGAYAKCQTNQLCKRLILLHKDVMPEFSKLAAIALCITLTSVECVRSFSTQNRLKSRYRASLKSTQLDTLMKISILGPDSHAFDPYCSIRRWLRNKKRRQKRLYSEYKPRPAKIAKVTQGTSQSKST